MPPSYSSMADVLVPLSAHDVGAIHGEAALGLRASEAGPGALCGYRIKYKALRLSEPVSTSTVKVVLPFATMALMVK